jgi:ubiquinone/menaquinone biosynthesis C-methylase UbiE
VGDLSKYHLWELEVARDRSSPYHVAPPFQPHHKRILDVGCGMGQTLLAANLPRDVAGYGIDPDHFAIEAGQRIAPTNVYLSVGSGEDLKFEDVFFDLVISRVAVPYMNISRALGEMQRVLKPGGEVWLVLHPVSMLSDRVRDGLRRRDYRALLFCGWLGVNSLLFNTTGKQLRHRGQTETVQTEKGIRKALARAGFKTTKVEQGTFFIVEARKPA